MDRRCIIGGRSCKSSKSRIPVGLAVTSYRNRRSDYICKSHLRAIKGEQTKRGTTIKKISVVQRDKADCILYNEDILQETQQLEEQWQGTSHDT